MNKIVWSKKDFRPEKILGLKKIWVQISFSTKNCGSKKVLVPNNFRSKIFGSKTIESPTKIWSPKITLAQKSFFSKRKDFGYKKNLVIKNP